MQTKIIEATNGEKNWGKFLVGRMDIEWKRRSEIPPFPGEYGHRTLPLLLMCAWGEQSIFVLDLQTGEGARFLPGGFAAADLQKRQIWVCPLFEPFLAWLYEQKLDDLDALPDHIDLPDAPFALHGYRRPGRGRR